MFHLAVEVQINSGKRFRCHEFGHLANDCPNNSTDEHVPGFSLGNEVITPSMCSCRRKCRIIISNNSTSPCREYKCEQCMSFEWCDELKPSASQTPNRVVDCSSNFTQEHVPHDSLGIAKDCPNDSTQEVLHVSDGNGSSDKCFKCQQLGHCAEDCPYNSTQEQVLRFSLSEDVIPPKMCHCGRECQIFISKTPANPGRKFYRCNQCNLFEWCDAFKASASQNANPNSHIQSPYPKLSSPSNNPNHTPKYPTLNPSTNTHEELAPHLSLRDKSSDKCFKCQQLGHWANACPNNSVQKKVPHLSLGNDVIPPKICHCLRECCILISNTSVNPGRKFYRCNQCNFFEWCDAFKASSSQNPNPNSQSQNPHAELSSPSNNPNRSPNCPTVNPSTSTHEELKPHVLPGNRSSDKCFKCQKIGHWAEDCPNNSTKKRAPHFSLGNDVIPPRMCQCHRECHIFTSNTSRNPGRKFYRCNQCNFFEWCDDFKAFASQNPNPSSQSQNPNCSLTSPSITLTIALTLPSETPTLSLMKNLDRSNNLHLLAVVGGLGGVSSHQSCADVKQGLAWSNCLN